MRSFANTLAVALLVLAPAVHAQTSQPKKLYEDALVRERILREDLQPDRTDEAQVCVLTRIRALVGAYDDMSRLFPSSGYGDNALWQGAVLAADAFWQFGDGIDRTTALRLFSALTSRFPSSSLTPKVSSQTRRLQDARPTTSSPPPRLAAAESAPSPAPTGLAALPAPLTAITREIGRASCRERV